MKRRRSARRGKRTPNATLSEPITHRVNTVKANGGLPTSTEIAPEPPTIGEAMRAAVEALGDVQIDSELAPAQLRELGEAYEEVTRRKAAFDAKNEEAKTAKKSLESAQDLLLEKVRSFTHPSPLPLFDAEQADADEAAMRHGGTVDDAGDEALA